jgi:hypothetical protein
MGIYIGFAEEHNGPPFTRDGHKIMPCVDNVLSELRLSNFKAFSRLQRIPLRPITLLYGPNGSGKSSVLEGLKWAASLADGSALALFDRYVRFHNAESSIDIGVDITLTEINPWLPDGEDFKMGLFNFLCESIRKISIDVTVSGSGLASPRVWQVLELSGLLCISTINPLSHGLSKRVFLR